MMKDTLLAVFLSLTAQWRSVFAQERTLVRAQRQALSSLLVLGRATISRMLWASGREQKSWSGEYFLHSRAPWEPQVLFAPLLQEALSFCPGRLVGVAADDTRLRKTGRLIQQAAWHRDPMSPPFHTNLILALRYLQASVLLPLHRAGSFPCRAVPIRFEEVSVVKKPGKRASEEALRQYRQDRKRFNLSSRFVGTMGQLRAALDEAGGRAKTLVIAGDGSFCNSTVFAGVPLRTELIVRARRNCKLCFPAPPGTRRIYAEQKFTPELVRQDDSIGWKSTKVFYGGKRRKIRYKEVARVLWQTGAGRRLLRLFVIAPTPYRKRKSSRKYYRDPAFLLTTGLISSAQPLLQIYFDRWQIGVSSQGHIVQSVRDRPRSKDSGLVAWEAPWRESKTAEPSDKHTRKECAQRTRLQRAVNAEVASLHELPVAETVYNARKQQELAETSPKRQLSPAGYQRRHGVKDDVETGEALDARRRNLVEEIPVITASGKCWYRHQGDGPGRSVR